MVFALGVLSIINLLLSTAAPGKRSLRADEEIVEDTLVEEAEAEKTVPEGRMIKLASTVIEAIQTLEEKYHNEH